LYEFFNFLIIHSISESIFLNLKNALLTMGVVTIQKTKKDVKLSKFKLRNIYIFSFKTMAIMASCLFIHMNVNEFKQKIHLMKF
jgi:hypothetical protein